VRRRTCLGKHPVDDADADDEDDGGFVKGPTSKISCIEKKFNMAVVNLSNQDQCSQTPG